LTDEEVRDPRQHYTFLPTDEVPRRRGDEEEEEEEEEEEKKAETIE
jgi:hypothetical protein